MSLALNGTTIAISVLPTMAANSDDDKTVRVLVSFFLTTECAQSSGQPIHKEKFNVPISAEHHSELHSFKRHLLDFTGLADIALSKGLGKSFELTLARVHKAVGGSVETFSVRTQDAWKHEFANISNGKGMLQGKCFLFLVSGKVYQFILLTSL